ncbi:MAG: hypothetical protein J6Q74_00270 [Clostridia bacterium]|nr:hypothetical protein [Clostridia bacterium]
MTALQTKKYLDQYRVHMAKACRLKRDMEWYEASRESMQREVEECIRKSNIIEGVICSFEDIRGRELMLRKYVYGQTIERIAEELNYSSRHVQRMLNDAAEKLGATIN